ncbi:hypothetical protein FKR81_35530 [Lentzea tibetensis]|uniref:Uncharacterized protein n=1 Tax=Lentzea tibetensis TaxID=2591470 RepID=A0A563EIU3_9PSEU|nr:hypothetical protein [Lentzea tibetensis]TWP46478.1 hypothetical protein FKR81_35530 [Lentzea tibetensis]
MILAEALELELDAIFVDDVDIFGSRAASLLRELTRGGKTVVVAAVRNTKLDFVPSTLRAADVSADDPLSDDDLRSLIKVLKTHGLLGVLKQHRWPFRRLEELRRMCEHSLLVAMIQVVTGQLFEDKVRSEFEQLDDGQALVYATICVLESAEVFKRRGVDSVDLLQIVSPGAPSARMERAIASLIHMRLVVRGSNGMIRCRQRTIADTVIKVVLKKRTSLLGEVMKSLIRFYAGYAGHIDDSNNPYRRTMVRLLNHALMIEFRLPDDTVREIYDSVQEFLDYDFHYWLQRGEFELQRNHLGIAANYFQSARGCGGEGDYKVETGWASVTLRRSAEDSSDSDKRQAAIAALKALDDVCRTRGTSSEHSFVVMARAGTEWLETVYKFLLERDFSVSVSTIKGVIELGRKISLDSFQFDRAVREYEPRLSRLIERNRGVPT